MLMHIVIPAHNEASIIGETVAQTIQAAGHCAVHVIADRCTDATAERARVAGARVHERHEGPSGKGAALAWFLETVEEAAAADAILVLDADSRLRPGAVPALTDVLVTGADAAQAFVYPVFDPRAPAAVLAAYNEWLSQTLDDRLRRKMRWPVRLRGTGMAIRRLALADAAPSLQTRVEDTELTLLLLNRGSRIASTPDAIVEDPKPREARFLARQRSRWLQGDREIWQHHGRTILRLLRTFNPGVWWLLTTLLLKPRSLVMLVKIGLLVVLWPWLSHPIARPLATLVAISALVNIAYAVAGVLLVPPSWRRPVLRALLRSPLYVGMWIWAMVGSLTSRQPWLRGRH